MQFNEQLTVLRSAYRWHGIRETKVKFITSQKWRGVMRRALERLRKKDTYDPNLIDDLQLIVNAIKEERFVEAIINIEPFKPKFENRHKLTETFKESPLSSPRLRLELDNTLQARNPLSRLKQSIEERLEKDSGKEDRSKRSLVEEVISYVTEEETLGRQFAARYHPFRKVIEQYLFLLENKYKTVLAMAGEHTNVEEVQEQLILDVRLLQQFVVKSSEPYLGIFHTSSAEEKELFQAKLAAFIRRYVDRHPEVNRSIHRIMRAVTRKCPVVVGLLDKMPDFAEVEQFGIDAECRIEGCYANAMSAMVEFSQATDSDVSLSQLKQVRRDLVADIDAYYSQRGEQHKAIEISAYTQIEILKFVVVKLKPFLWEIYAQLKYLEVVYGEHDINYKYDDASYMYAQVTISIQQLAIDHRVIE